MSARTRLFGAWLIFCTVPACAQDRRDEGKASAVWLRRQCEKPKLLDSTPRSPLARARDCAAVSTAWRLVASRRSASGYPTASDTAAIVRGEVSVRKTNVLSKSGNRIAGSIEETILVVFTDKSGKPLIFVSFTSDGGRLKSIGPPYD